MADITITPAVFRKDLPEFRDVAVYPDSGINYWLSLADKLFNKCRWGELLDHGVEQFIAHNLVLEAWNKKTVDVGGIPGLNRGIISSETPGQVSLSYDTASIANPEAGHWNYTMYGNRYLWLARRVGAGPLQIGTGSVQSGTSTSSGTAWGGPPVGPGWLGS